MGFGDKPIVIYQNLEKNKNKNPLGVLLCSKIILKGPNFGIFILVFSFLLNRMKEERWFHRIHLFSRVKGRSDLKLPCCIH